MQSIWFDLEGGKLDVPVSRRSIFLFVRISIFVLPGILWFARIWLYVVALFDLYTRRSVGWAMDQMPSLAVNALKMAIAQRRPASALIVHSDRGSQFASAAFRDTLRANQLVASMSRKANCYDNAHMESFWSNLKLSPQICHAQRGALGDL
ncbi:DDE-type integrase/transposase/recombinase [Termitidicoccus mucosus]|uniref:Integrase catalytic domain-containing protein n=1 Tax=Termitidicoccus mucosus TaxID=1184151 RepID=A0A178IP31_9BACT|nr:hypothetical protein AW736_03110 [Opitutaceae bacterium TSB47]